VIRSAYARWQRETAEEINTPFIPGQAPLSSALYCSIRRRTAPSSSPRITLSPTAFP
jgi:hypothetical protein